MGISKGEVPNAHMRMESLEEMNEDQLIRADPLGTLLEFLEVPGHVLLIQGAPGTGKTTLAFELLNHVQGAHKVYASSRVSPAKMRQHFPWIDEVIDSMSGRTARGSLIDKFHDIRGAEAENILSNVIGLKHSKQRAVLVIDSWEGAIRNANPEGQRMLESAILSELDQTGVSVVLITEGGGGGDLGYLVDGIVTLSQSEVDGRMVRVLTLNKLRGFRVPVQHVLFTLDKGRFTILPTSVQDGSHSNKNILLPVPNTNTMFSTGSHDLDNVLGGGIMPGGFVLIDTESNVPPQRMRMLLNLIRANFINQGGSCFIVATETYSSENVAEQLSPYVGTKAMDERVRISEYNPALPETKWRVKMTGKLLEDMTAFYAVWEGLKTHSSRRMLNLNFDRILQVYGEDLTLPGFTEMGEQMWDARGLFIGVASRSTKLRDEFLRTADYHLKIQCFNDSMLIYGIKPFTPVYGARFSFDNGYPSLSMLEMV